MTLTHRLPILRLFAILCLLASATVALFAPQAAAQAQAEPPTNGPVAYRYFAETGHNVGGPFLQFYTNHGSTEIFGLPLTEVITDTATGRQVQYFERARFEFYPQQPAGSQVALTNLGTILTADQQSVAFQSAIPKGTIPPVLGFPEQRLRVFSKTGFPLHGAVGAFWQAHGGAEIFGQPISKPLIEHRAGQPVLVQYFERARLEYIRAEPNEIRLGLLGREYLDQHPLPPELLAPAPEIVQLATATTPYYRHLSPEGQNILLSARKIDGMVIAPGAEMSFLDAVGAITPAAGFVDGYGIVGEQIVPMIGGGICQTSSALYEAALGGGLEIVERHNHSYLLNFFAHQPGIEAAVYTSGQVREDLRWRNDTDHPIYVVARPDHAAQVLHVSLWGVSDGRVITLSAPTIMRQYSSEETWTLDETMPEGEHEQMQAGIPGMDVVVWRQVEDTRGNVLHTDEIVTRYAPLGAVFRHGIGGNPNEEAPAEDEEDVIDDPTRGVLDTLDPAPVTEPEPVAEPAPVTEPEPVAEPAPVTAPDPDLLP